MGGANEAGAGREKAVLTYSPRVAIYDEGTDAMLRIVGLDDPTILYCEEFNKVWVGRGQYAKPYYPES